MRFNSVFKGLMTTHSSLVGGPKKRTEISKYYYCFCAVSLTGRDESCSKL
jgi:hypothetical protein